MKLVSKWHQVYKNPKKHEEIVKYEDSNNIIIKELKKICKLDDKIVLDLGAGTGRQTVIYSKIAKKVYAVDPSKENIKFLKSKQIANIIPKLGKAEKIPLKNNTADIAISTFSIASGLVDKDKTIKEILRVVKPKGKIIIVDAYYKGELIDIWRTHSDRDVAGWMYNGFLRIQDMYNFKIKIIETSWEFPTVKKAAEIFGYLLSGTTKRYIINNKKKKIKMKVFIAYGEKNGQRLL
ncbi:MAG: class I SAM-dependent methyltransferase [Nanoarchaeota archaeon]